MTHERDIDRLLDRWLLDGPTEVADRVILDVAARIDRKPQRPAWRFLWRPTTMNPSARWAAVLVTVTLIAVVGFAVLGRPSDSGVGTTPTATPQPSGGVADNAIPPELNRVWIGTPTPVEALGPNHDRSWLRFPGAGGGDYLEVIGGDNTLPTTRVPSMVYPVSFPQPGRLEVRAISTEDGCAVDDVGTYDWTLSPTGMTLTLARVDDQCASRATILTGDWWLSDCRDTSLECLGMLDAGTYASTVFEPFPRPGAAPGTRAFGQLTYTVPEGWANAGEWPAGYFLMPQAEYSIASGAGLLHGIYVHRDPIVTLQDGSCTDAADPSVGTTAAELADGIARIPGLIIGERSAITVDGRSGTMFDVRLDPGWTKGCPWATAMNALMVLHEAGDSEGWGLSISQIDRWRLILLDVAPDETIAIVIADSLTRDRFDELVAKAMPVVESFEFHPPAP